MSSYNFCEFVEDDGSRLGFVENGTTGVVLGINEQCFGADRASALIGSTVFAVSGVAWKNCVHADHEQYE